MNDLIKAVSSGDFDREILQSERPVLVDFYADWCGPCRMLRPVLEQLASDYAGRVDIRKLDVDANPSLAQEYGVRSIPTLLLFKTGRAQETLSGVHSRAQLAELLERAA